LENTLIKGTYKLLYILLFLSCIKLNTKGAFIEATLESKKTKTPKTDLPKGTTGNNKPERETM